MRYRKLSSSGDRVFGQQQANFWVNQPEAVAQSVLTRLRLQLGDWFLDTTDGTDWRTRVLGERTAQTRDSLIRMRVLLTPGVLQIDNYSSGIDPNTRAFAAKFALDTIYGKFLPVQQNFITPAATPQPEPPLPAQGVTVTVLSETEVQADWTPYVAP